MSLWLIFMAGLTVGGLGCLAVQGGLLASATANRPALPATTAFLLAKITVYALLGFLLGSFGGSLNISGQFQTYMQLLAGIYMLLVAANLLDLDPVFRYVVIQPPKFIARLVKNQSRSEMFFAPLLLGVLTIFIPCGTTLAMEALAISTASGVRGAAIMIAFTLGTLPLFLGIGFFTSLLGEAKKAVFIKIAAGLIIILGLTSIYGSLVALGFYPSQAKGSRDQTVSQNAEITITSSGYSPNYIRVHAGSPVTLKLIGQSNFSCASAFRIPALGIAKNLAPNETTTLGFTFPKPGKYQFNCSMGMYTGVIEAI